MAWEWISGVVGVAGVAGTLLSPLVKGKLDTQLLQKTQELDTRKQREERTWEMRVAMMRDVMDLLGALGNLIHEKDSKRGVIELRRAREIANDIFIREVFLWGTRELFHALQEVLTALGNVMRSASEELAALRAIDSEENQVAVMQKIGPLLRAGQPLSKWVDTALEEVRKESQP